MDETEENGRRVARWGVTLVLVGLLALVSLVPAYIAKAVYVDWLWYASVGFQGVYLTMVTAQVGLFLAGGGLFFALLLGNALLARRLTAARLRAWQRDDVAAAAAAEASTAAALAVPADLPGAAPRIAPPATPAADDERPSSFDPTGIVLLVGGIVALVLGWWASGKWDTVLRLGHQTPFGLTDPLFERDISYFVFQLPVSEALRSWLLWATGCSLLAIAATYFARLVVPQSMDQGRAIDPDTGERRVDLRFGTGIRTHLSLAGAAWLGVLAWHYRLSMYELSYSTRGATAGAGFTDVSAYWPALWALLAVALVGAVALLLGVVVRGPWIALGIAVVFVPLWLGGTVIYPWVVQRFQVAPNELERERPYIERNIQFTRRAYGLDKVQEAPFPVSEAVTRAEVEANPTTLRNVRLWDYAPLLATYNQIQSIRGYYDFLDADFDRYVIDGEYRQVMIAGRELSPHKLPADAQTWVNRRLQFTHGYGVVVSPVNEVTPEGLPELFAQDVPPRGKIAVTRPEIYYGEEPGDWLVVKTAIPEFDYPRGNDNVQATYQGNSGVGIGSLWRRILFAWQLRDVNLLVTPALRPESQILFNRNIHERVRKVAPFLLYDGDPYLVVADGRLVWLYDAYTYSGRYPYAQPVSREFNYLRNSVKITIDAYDGSMHFYVADADDPLIRAYAGVFPELFQPLDEMPPALRSHIRYPGTMFTVQAQMYRLYHMQDPRVFYQREDQLSVPTEVYLGQQRPVPVQPYYAIMRLPGEAREEFVYILPYTPPGKDNMNTWLAARSDGANYGKLVAFNYPKETLIFGPMQVEARIDQDPTISAQFTLWNQGGSRVLRGNMLAVPVGRSNLYVEPIYLQAERSRLPEMKRVVVATGNRVAMGTTVEEALAQLYEGPINYTQQPARPTTVTAPAAPVAQAPPAAATATTGTTATAPSATAAAAAQPVAAATPAPAGAAAAASGTAAGDRAALLEALRSLQDRSARLQQEMAGMQSDLQKVRDALEKGQ